MGLNTHTHAHAQKKHLQKLTHIKKAKCSKPLQVHSKCTHLKSIKIQPKITHTHAYAQRDNTTKPGKTH